MLDRGLSKGGGCADSVREAVRAQQSRLRKQGCGGNGRRKRCSLAARLALSRGQALHSDLSDLKETAARLKCRANDEAAKSAREVAGQASTSATDIAERGAGCFRCGRASQDFNGIGEFAHGAAGALIGMMGAAQLMLFGSIFRPEWRRFVLTLKDVFRPRQEWCPASGPNSGRVGNIVFPGQLGRAGRFCRRSYCAPQLGVEQLRPVLWISGNRRRAALDCNYHVHCRDYQSEFVARRKCSMEARPRQFRSASGTPPMKNKNVMETA
jgi:hypothetical protein